MTELQIGIFIYLAVGIVIAFALAQVFDIGEFWAIIALVIVWPIVILGMLGMQIGKCFGGDYHRNK